MESREKNFILRIIMLFKSDGTSEVLGMKAALLEVFLCVQVYFFGLKI
jgi:hypothetical protein